MAAGTTKPSAKPGQKGGLAHRGKSAPKKSEAKTLKRKRGQEDLGKLQTAVDELVRMPSTLQSSLSPIPPF